MITGSKGQLMITGNNRQLGRVNILFSIAGGQGRQMWGHICFKLTTFRSVCMQYYYIYSDELLVSCR